MFKTIFLLSAAMCIPAMSAGRQAAAERTEDRGPVEKAVDRRAARIVDAMTLDEQIQVVRGLNTNAFADGGMEELVPLAMRKRRPAGAIGSAAFVPGIPRLGVPAQQISDAGLGISNQGGAIRRGDEATALPSTLALAATFDLSLAKAYGAVIGEEAHAKGFNVQLAGGINLARDVRGGRNFEYSGEDPLLAGRMVGATVTGIQNQAVVSTIKHFAFNDQESGRVVLSAKIAEPAARESDLLAFEIAIAEGRPGSVMCAYNKVNGEPACANGFLLNQVLKRDWGYRGWVMSDWSAVPNLQAVTKGLDQQSPQDNDPFGGLKAAVERGDVPRARVRDMAFRVVRSMIAVGAFDRPAKPGGFIDRQAHAAIAQRVAEEGAVLLKNDGLLPLAASVKRVVLIGGHADKWVALGGGSSQVNPFGGIQYEQPIRTMMDLFKPAFVPSSPMAALRALREDLSIVYDDGSDPNRAAAAARSADVAIIFATNVQTEGGDPETMLLPGGQNDLIGAVAAANPHSVVVLETGSPVAMPWIAGVKSVLEVWYPGQRGGEAIAALLTGRASPAGRLPIGIPRSLDQLPRPKLDGWEPIRGMSNPNAKPFVVDYDKEGSDIGYRWFERTNSEPLFPFGHGLTYTTFSYDRLRLGGGKNLVATFRITNTGEREGTEVAQLYVAPPGRTHRLAGWARITLKPGESRPVTITADARILASWRSNGWSRQRGEYDVWAAPAATRAGLHGIVRLDARSCSGGVRGSCGRSAGGPPG